MKKIFFVLILFLFAGKNLSAQGVLVPINPVTDSIVEFAKSFLGTPYKYASASPKAGFDCSGFTYFVFAHYGFTVPRSAKDYANFGTVVSIAECRKGDIILFRGTHPGDKQVGHVGIVISNKGEPLQFIHSSSSDNHYGVVITDYFNSAYPARFIKIIRVIN
jgi:lipoprotein Spr